MTLDETYLSGGSFEELYSRTDLRSLCDTEQRYALAALAHGVALAVEQRDATLILDGLFLAFNYGYYSALGAIEETPNERDN